MSSHTYHAFDTSLTRWNQKMLDEQSLQGPDNLESPFLLFESDLCMAYCYTECCLQ
jgi:hypothetical protein